MRNIFHIRIGTALLFGLMAAGLSAQRTQPATPDPAQGSQLKVNPLRALQQLEPAENEAYELGPGDTINIYVAAHPELTKLYVIGPDGFITMDIAGSIKITDLTREAAANTVHDMLANYFTEPSVTIGVEKYGSNTVMIFGNVKNPGILAYEGTKPTLLDAIGRAGLLINPASPDGLPDRCIIYRGSSTVVPVELGQLLKSSSPLADIRLRRGDKIFVPIDQMAFVSVLGQVGKPGPVQITNDLDLKMTITRAGGLKDEAGENPTIHVIQTASNQELTIPFKELMKPGGGREIALHPGDMVFIPKSGFNKVMYGINKISPVATIISLGALIVP